MRLALTLMLMSAADSAWAHFGHIADVAGHGHWVGAAAIGLAILVGIAGKLKGGQKAETEAEPETEEVPA